MIDLTNCDKEPIHLPGAVQPHGVLLALSEPGLEIQWVSESCEAILDAHPRALLGKRVSELLHPSREQGLLEALRTTDLRALNPLKVVLRANGGAKPFDAIAHRHGGQLILELEPSTELAGASFSAVHARVRGAISRLRASRDLQELCNVTATELRGLTGFDRVLVYTFDPDWHGTVVAEARSPSVDSYLGQRFPGSDIPRQARELYRLNWLRIIPDVSYRPSPLVARDEKAPPLDLSFSVLRSVSPVHVEYLKNMGATASMSVSLLKGDQLWGLITCTHESGPRKLPYEIRVACELLGEITSSLLGAKALLQDRDYRAQLQAIQSALLTSMAQEQDFVPGLLDHRPNLLDLTNSTGAAVYFNQRIYAVGKAPDPQALEELIRWLAQRAERGLYVTDHLAGDYPGGEKLREVAAGLIAAPLSRGRHNYVMWFRPEVLQTVSWGGNPHQPVDPSGVHPRKSFELWKETVHLRSLPWKEPEKEAAAELLRSIVDLVLQKSEKLEKLNTELERSNLELDAFAYAASHDLKEPLRGIHNYTALVIRELGDNHLVGESRDRLKTVIKLTQRMDDLVSSLLHYSHVGRMDLSLREVDLNELVEQTQQMLKPRLEESRVELRIPRRLPVVRGDRVLLGEVFSNLLTNAIKYNDKPERWAEVGFEEATSQNPLTFHVRDNGIGIQEKNHDTIFKIFRRLHARDRYGGGTGTGLTITKRIVERHGGKIWLRSSAGEGTSFFFTLAGGATHVE
jgi:chemotaxis family two-component system sensor kinase Cph1